MAEYFIWEDGETQAFLYSGRDAKDAIEEFIGANTEQYNGSTIHAVDTIFSEEYTFRVEYSLT